MMFDEGEYYSPSEVVYTSCVDSYSSSKKRKTMMNKRRFTDEQVRSLESIFENETKLEPKKKAQVARELGLQPRQVAIWFQNKRARYKSKQLERDYSILRTNYNDLTSQFEALKREKESLLLQVQKLKEVVEKQQSCCNKNSSVEIQSSRNEKSWSSPESEVITSKKIMKGEEARPGLSVEGSEQGGASILSDEDGSSDNTNDNDNDDDNYFGMEREMLAMAGLPGVVGGSLTTSADDEPWDDLRPDGLFDQQGGDSSQWWDFWS